MNRILALLFVSLILSALTNVAEAAPMATFGSETGVSRLSIRVKRLDGSKTFLPDKLQAKALPEGIQWEYLPGANVSVPTLTFELDGLSGGGENTVLLERIGKLTPDSAGRYLVRLTILEAETTAKLSVISPYGAVEEWEISIVLALKTTAIFLDENCLDYALKVRELKRSAHPSLIFLGCRPGSSPHHLSLDLFWQGADKIKFRGKVTTLKNNLVTLPLDHRRKTVSPLLAGDEEGGRVLLEFEYEPVLPAPYEFWAGLAFFQTSFKQSNFDSDFNQFASAFMGKAWYRPEDVDISLMLRGFGSLVSFSDKLTPPQDFEESVQTYFFSTDLRYKVMDQDQWRISPFIGGWFFFMRVASRQFGTQRVITPVLGVSVERAFGSRNRADLTLRFASLQQFFNPLEFSLNRAYLEIEGTFIHELKGGNRLFGTVYFGNLKFQPESLVTTEGSYLVLGGGYGW